jgi:hypothetical protein
MLNNEMIRKIRNKSRLNSEMILKMRKKVDGNVK